MDKLYTCSEISDRYSVPVGTVWLWIRKKKLPAIKIGKEYRIRQEDITMFEKSNETVAGGT